MFGNAAKVRQFERERFELCQLVDIRREGRLNVFTFARHDELFTIETMGLLSDNLQDWNKKCFG